MCLIGIFLSSETSKKGYPTESGRKRLKQEGDMSLASGGKLVGQHLPVVLSVYGTTPSRRRLVERPENAPSLLMCARYEPHRCWRAGGVPKARIEKVDCSLARAILFSLNSVATRMFLRRTIYPILFLL